MKDASVILIFRNIIMGIICLVGFSGLETCRDRYKQCAYAFIAFVAFAWLLCGCAVYRPVGYDCAVSQDGTKILTWVVKADNSGNIVWVPASGSMPEMVWASTVAKAVVLQGDAQALGEKRTAEAAAAKAAADKADAEAKENAIQAAVDRRLAERKVKPKLNVAGVSGTTLRCK